MTTPSGATLPTRQRAGQGWRVQGRVFSGFEVSWERPVDLGVLCVELRGLDGFYDLMTGATLHLTLINGWVCFPFHMEHAPGAAIKP